MFTHANDVVGAGTFGSSTCSLGLLNVMHRDLLALVSVTCWASKSRRFSLRFISTTPTRFVAKTYNGYLYPLSFVRWCGVGVTSNDLARGATAGQTAGGFTEFAELIMSKLPDCEILFMSILRSPYQVQTELGKPFR
eukprot:3585993-Pyramimonas_sp.AAC.1